MLDRTLTPTQGCTLGSYKNVSLIAWRTRAEAAHVDAMVDFATHLLDEYERFSVIHIVEESAGLPTAEGRDRFVAMRARNKGHLAVLALLLPNASVLATMLRAFVRGLRTIARGDLQVLIEQDLDQLLRDFVRLHAQQTGVKLTTVALAAAIAELQGRAG